MLKIGDFSKLSRVSVRMLRHYDEIGLLKPVETDPFSGYRYYREDQLFTAGRIAALRSMGFSLAAVGEILACGDSARMEEYLRVREAELREELEQARRRLRLLDTARERLRKDETMNYNVVLKTFPERQAASVRMVIPSYDDEGTLWNVLCAETDAIPLIPDNPCLCSAIFHDAEYKESDVDVEVQKTVKGTYRDTEHVRFKTEPPVTAACAIHNGSYETLSRAMEAVAEWIRDNGCELSGPAFNIYHISPHETQNPDEFVTEVCCPVRKK